MKYHCCDHCLLFFGECADGVNDHTSPCPEEGCPEGAKPVSPSA